MTNYEKLCEAVGIKQKPQLTKLGDKIYTYPDFTAKKQIELIKLIGLQGNINIVKHDYNGLWSITTHYKNGMSENENFSETLVNLVLQLIEAGELNNEKVRKVLK